MNDIRAGKQTRKHSGKVEIINLKEQFCVLKCGFKIKTMRYKVR